MLEIGSYPGYFAWCLRAADHDATGVDLDPARTAAFDARHHLRTLRCDVEREPLPVASGSCALVVMCEVLEHLRVDPGHALAEAARVLRPGGTLFLQTPNAYSAGNIARFVSGRGLFPPAPDEFAKLARVGHMGHIREYTRREVVDFVQRAGLRVTTVRAVAHARARRGLLADLAYAILPPLRPYHMVLARKT